MTQTHTEPDIQYCNFCDKSNLQPIYADPIAALMPMLLLSDGCLICRECVEKMIEVIEQFERVGKCLEAVTGETLSSADLST